MDFTKVIFPEAVKVSFKKKNTVQKVQMWELVIIVFYVSFGLLDFLGL